MTTQDLNAAWRRRDVQVISPEAQDGEIRCKGDLAIQQTSAIE
jgi:hypothetical protein